MAKFFPASSFSLLPSLLCPFLSSIQKCNSFCSQLTSFVISKENHRFQVQKGFLTCDQINLHIHFPLKFVFCFNLPSFSHLTFHLWILVGGVRRECNQISSWAQSVCSVSSVREGVGARHSGSHRGRFGNFGASLAVSMMGGSGTQQAAWSPSLS